MLVHDGAMEGDVFAVPVLSDPLRLSDSKAMQHMGREDPQFGSHSTSSHNNQQYPKKKHERVPTPAKIAKSCKTTVVLATKYCIINI